MSSEILKFNLASMPFVSNLETRSQYTDVGLSGLCAAADLTAGDYSQFFMAVEKLIDTCNQVYENDLIYQEDLLFDNLFTVKSKAKEDGGRMVEAIYGGSIKRDEDQLILSFGKKRFPITQSGKTLSIGALTGDITSEEIKREDGSKYYAPVWTAYIQDGEDVLMFAFPVMLLKEKGKDGKDVSVVVTPATILTKIAPKNALIDYVAQINSGSDGGSTYGTVNSKIDGESIFKAYELSPSIGVSSYKVVGVRHSKAINKEDGEEFDSLLAQLEDGRKANLNSDAQKLFLSLSEDDRASLFPIMWDVDKYAPKKSKTSFVAISKPTTSSTKLSPRLQAMMAATAVSTASIASAPVKSAALVGGSSADFDKLVESQASPESQNYDDEPF